MALNAWNNWATIIRWFLTRVIVLKSLHTRSHHQVKLEAGALSGGGYKLELGC